MTNLLTLKQCKNVYFFDILHLLGLTKNGKKNYLSPPKCKCSPKLLFDLFLVLYNGLLTH